MSTQEKPVIEQKMAENAAAGIAGLKELAMLDNGALDKIARLEKLIFYRQFYFPGGEPDLRLPGLGTDKPGKYKYDQIPGERYMLDDWDPRYIEEYITQAKQNGFHRHFLYFDGSSVKTMSYDEAADKLMYAIEGVTFRADDKDEAFGILSGLMYMNKLPTFCEEYSSKLGMSKAQLERLANVNGRTLVTRADEQLKRLIGQSKDNFIKKDLGWYSQDLKYAFDVKQYAAEWEQQQAKYEEYKLKIWKILENTQSLNLCTNRTSGINIGNVNIQQAMDCAMKIENNMLVDDVNGSKDDAQAVPPASEPSAPQQTPQTPQAVPQTAPQAEPSAVPQAAPPATPQTAPQQTTQAVENDTTNTTSSKSYGTIVLIIVIIILIVGGVAFAMLRNSMNLLKTLENSKVFGE